jgi:nicotinamidase-related amidase
MIALLLIDIQEGIKYSDYYGSERNNPEAETQAASLLQYFRDNDLPVYHIKHNSTFPDSPLFPGKPGNLIQVPFQPMNTEPLFEKTVNSAFIGTGLEERLRQDGINTLLMVGLTTDHCISTTARMAANLGFQVILASDAMAAFDRIGANNIHFTADTMHQSALASLNNEFALVQTTAEILKGLINGSTKYR